ncbi:glutamate-5-semialdehyde dehydrogenase [Cohnella lupini]|uniref:Gamma-glutamyl phosphate reductase n=1 Tax=Cohnella lupini TaxID=1294267 RepID=A0A3D9IFF0_9BACL|nr:glutamate-5-semialdehyde dehydrogenase [Cohnella lupini]RED60387.1 glutamate-5-semialdehyde dehydrogenase [Cohnella lupini]
MSEVILKATAAKDAANVLNRLTTAQKNEALILVADALLDQEARILAANEEDLARGKESGTSPSLLDRLKLTPARLKDISDAVRLIVELPDPVGELLDTYHRPNGLFIEKRSVPLGVIGIIYEARPNVTVDAATLCLKSGNSVVLRGGSAALASNRAIIAVMREALSRSSVPADALQLIEDSDRGSVDEMLKLNGLLDVIIPRGGASLIQNVVKNATVPVIETGEGVCHTYIDASGEYAMAESISVNAKAQRPSVCNSMETLIVHQAFARAHLVSLAEKFREVHVELRGCDVTRDLVSWAKPASDADYATEYSDYILNVKVVNDLEEALGHIQRFGTKHSECIVTEDAANADRFMQEVDAAAVYHNASTRFTDGFEFGFGAEIGISTQKLHARGPMGLPALTSTKYRVVGTGQIRT